MLHPIAFRLPGVPGQQQIEDAANAARSSARMEMFLYPHLHGMRFLFSPSLPLRVMALQPRLRSVHRHTWLAHSVLIGGTGHSSQGVKSSVFTRGACESLAGSVMGDLLRPQPPQSSETETGLLSLAVCVIWTWGAFFGGGKSQEKTESIPLTSWGSLHVETDARGDLCLRLALKTGTM